MDFKNIYLIGMMGSGKSTLADAVAAISPWKALDLDAAIVSDTGKTVQEIFGQQGEAYFREVESNILYDVHKLQNLVVATGGGVVLRKENVELMHHSGLIVYVERDVDAIIESIDAESRPLLSANADNVRRIYEERRALYENAAMVTVQNSGSIAEAASQIVHAAATADF